MPRLYERTLPCANEDCAHEIVVTQNYWTIQGPITCPACGARWTVEASTSDDEGRAEFHPVTP